MRLAMVSLVSLVSSIAAAEPPRPSRTTDDDIHVAAGVNFPVWWGNAESIAGSLYFGVTRHDAIRLNIASYRNHSSMLGDVISVADGGDGDESLRRGRILDAGVAWTNYSRGLWEGFTFELGALVRTKDIRVEDEFASPEILATATNTYAARVQVGWSWLIGGHVFIAAAFGASLGYEAGTETSDRSYDSMPMQTDVSRAALSGEGYLRFGLAR